MDSQDVTITEAELYELNHRLSILKTKMKCLESFSCALPDNMSDAKKWIMTFSKDSAELLNQIKSDLE